ncbi:hypothetical protein HMSSN036_06470 [Paenibacillus macerans]|nr:hypothetical protein BK140_16440 [Paenibacillus macerans]GJM68431.1 hypothetical protein HMSSN036_06470 [Paenibacillus macerans]
MSDGYFGIYIKPKYEEILSGFVSEIYKDFKLFTGFNEGVWSDELNKDTKIEDIYLKDKLFGSNTVIFVKEDSAKGNATPSEEKELFLRDYEIIKVTQELEVKTYGEGS